MLSVQNGASHAALTISCVAVQRVKVTLVPCFSYPWKMILMLRFGGERLNNFMNRFNIPDDMPVRTMFSFV